VVNRLSRFQARYLHLPIYSQSTDESIYALPLDCGSFRQQGDAHERFLGKGVTMEAMVHFVAAHTVEEGLNSMLKQMEQ
jgi:hypothetical protein